MDKVIMAVLGIMAVCAVAAVVIALVPILLAAAPFILFALGVVRLVVKRD